MEKDHHRKKENKKKDSSTTKISFEPSGNLDGSTTRKRKHEEKRIKEEGKEESSGREDRHSSTKKQKIKEEKKDDYDDYYYKRSGRLDKGETSNKRTKDKNEEEKEREKPSFEPSGKLAQDTNTFKGVVVKYNEPPEAKIPKLRWRIYPFKGEESLPVIYIHRQSAYLIGRDHKVADFPIDHPSCSKQHAALQYRSMPFERADGSKGRRTRPYIIDLGSGNGTFLNGERIESQHYYELKEKDVLKFGFSSREYVMLNEQSLKGNIDEEDTSEDEEEYKDIIERSEKDQEKLEAAEEDDLF